jgi:hypothetical protein
MRDPTGVRAEAVRAERDPEVPNESTRRANERLDEINRRLTAIQRTRRHLRFISQAHERTRLTNTEIQGCRWVILLQFKGRPGIALAACSSLSAAKEAAARFIGQGLAWRQLPAVANAALPRARDRWWSEISWTEDPEKWEPEMVTLYIDAVPG